MRVRESYSIGKKIDRSNLWIKTLPHGSWEGKTIVRRNLLRGRDGLIPVVLDSATLRFSCFWVNSLILEGDTGRGY